MYEESFCTISPIVFPGLNHMEIKGLRLILIFSIPYTPVYKRTVFQGPFPYSLILYLLPHFVNILDQAYLWCGFKFLYTSSCRLFPSSLVCCFISWIAIRKDNCDIEYSILSISSVIPPWKLKFGWAKDWTPLEANFLQPSSSALIQTPQAVLN